MGSAVAIICASLERLSSIGNLVVYLWVVLVAIADFLFYNCAIEGILCEVADTNMQIPGTEVKIFDLMKN